MSSSLGRETTQVARTDKPCLTPEEQKISRTLRRKVDMRILPLTVVVYVMNFIDRNNYAAARLQGLEADLGLSNTQYQAGLSMFFVGYLLGQVPANIILNWFARPSIHIAFATCAWGTVSAMTALVKGFRGLATCRLVLGLVEAPFYPGVMFCLSKWYTKEELNFRMAIFLTGTLISGAFGNLIAAAILGGIGHARGISPWQWLYIMEGSVTVVAGVAAYFLMPDFPETWRGLSNAERAVAVKRLAMDASEADIDDPGLRGQLRGLKMALADRNLYILALMNTIFLGVGGFNNFFPSMAENIGNSKTMSLLLCVPPYSFCTFWLLAHAWASDRLRTRFWFIIYPIPITIAGFAAWLASGSPAIEYFGMFLMVTTWLSSTTTFSWVATSLPRPPAKRAAAMAFTNAMASSSSIWTPFIYEPTKFARAMYVNIALTAVAGVLAMLFRFLLARRNRELARLEDPRADLGEKEMAKLRRLAEADGTDIATARKRSEGFRYLL